MRTAHTANTLFTGDTYRKGKAVPVHAMKAYGRVMIKLHSLLNLGNARVSGQLQAPAVSPSGKVSPLLIIQETVGRAPEPVWMIRMKNLLLVLCPTPSSPSTNYCTLSRLRRDIGLRGHDRDVCLR